MSGAPPDIHAGPEVRAPTVNMGFELSWTPEADGECGQCESAGGLCGRRRLAGHGAWTFACFRAAAAANPALISPKTPGTPYACII
jgi:hypothetical protein